MAFNSYEVSTEDGRPIIFYRFTLGATVWRYCTADEDLTVAADTWKAAPISDSGVKQTGQSMSDTMTIDAPDRIGPAAVFGSSPPGQTMTLEILRSHEGQTDLQVTYVGEVIQCNTPLPGKAVFSVQALSATMKRTGLRMTWQRTCPHVLYDQLTCRASKAANSTNATIVSVSAFQVVVTTGSQPNNILYFSAAAFSGGFMQWSDDVQGTRTLTIEAQNGTTLTMFDDTTDLYPGLSVTLFKGCNRTTSACSALGNLDNYGGCPWMPGKSPFDGISTPFF